MYLTWLYHRHPPQVPLLLPLLQGTGLSTRKPQHTCQVPHPFFLASPTYLLHNSSPLSTGVHAQFEAKAWLHLHHPFHCLTSSTYPIFPSTLSPSVQSPKHSSARCHFILIIAFFRTCGRVRGLVWGVRPAGVFTSLFLISLRLAYAAFSPSRILLFNGIVVWAILVLPNFDMPYLGFPSLILLASHVSWASIFVPPTLALTRFRASILLI